MYILIMCHEFFVLQHLGHVLNFTEGKNQKNQKEPLLEIRGTETP